MQREKLYNLLRTVYFDGILFIFKKKQNTLYDFSMYRKSVAHNIVYLQTNSTGLEKPLCCGL